MNQIPAKFPICLDDYHAKHIGRTKDQRQFFLTTPFVPATEQDPGQEFIALFSFDAGGKFLEATIDSLGSRDGLDESKASKLYEQRLESLGEISLEDICIEPFQTVVDGIEFGLFAREPEDEDDLPVIEMHPGNYMAFFEPWDGDYDT